MQSLEDAENAVDVEFEKNLKHLESYPSEVNELQKAFADNKKKAEGVKRTIATKIRMLSIKAS